MTANKVYARGCGYVLTEKGAQALLEDERCQCEFSFEGFLVVCRLCGTVWFNRREEYLYR